MDADVFHSPRDEITSRSASCLVRSIVVVRRLGRSHTPGTAESSGDALPGDRKRRDKVDSRGDGFRRAGQRKQVARRSHIIGVKIFVVAEWFTLRRSGNRVNGCRKMAVVVRDRSSSACADLPPAHSALVVTQAAPARPEIIDQHLAEPARRGLGAPRTTRSP